MKSGLLALDARSRHDGVRVGKGGRLLALELRRDAGGLQRSGGHHRLGFRVSLRAGKIPQRLVARSCCGEPVFASKRALENRMHSCTLSIQEQRACGRTYTAMARRLTPKSTLGRLMAMLFILVSFAKAPSAWAYACTGTLDSVYLNPSGVITVVSSSSGLGTFYVCEIGATANGVSAEVCNSILAQLIAAKEAGEQVQWQFNDSLTCQTHAQWSWLTGWYFGPGLL